MEGITRRSPNQPYLSPPWLTLWLSLPLLLQQEFSGSSPKRRRGAEEKDEGIGSPDILEEEKTEDLRREMVELRQQLDKERSVRMMLEEHLRQEEVGAETHNHNK